MDVGDTAPELALTDHTGGTWRLSDHLGRPVVLVFHRHLMCLPCQEHVRQVGERVEELGDAAVAVVTFADPDRLADFHRYLDVPFPILTDRDRAAYAAFDLERAPWRRIYNAGTLRMYWRLLRQGRRPRKPTEDTRQLGADVVIGPDGTVVYLHRPPSPDTRPPVDELVTAVAASRRPSDD